MKFWLLFAVSGWAVFAQTPLPPKVPEDKVVAKVDGRDVTAGEVNTALRAMPPQFVQMYNQNPKFAIQQLFMMRYFSDEAEKLKLGDTSPYKEQLAVQRADVLASALLSFRQDNSPVSDEDTQKFYNDHKDQYQQAKIRAIAIRFKEIAPPNAPVEVRARVDMQNSITGVTRSADEAKTRAAEVAEKLKGGADFAKLVEEYSEDTGSKGKGGDFGVVTFNSAHLDEIKQVVGKMKAGETSEPVHTSNAYLILRVDEKSQLPEERVDYAIKEELRKVQFKAWFDDVSRRFQPVVETPEFFTQQAPMPAMPPQPKIR